MQIRTCLALAACVASLTHPAGAGPLEDLKPGEWYEVPDSRMDAVKPDPLPYGFFAAMMEAWSGAAFDGKRGRLVVWGGGHNDYAGNELYAFDINALKWSRLKGPSADVGGSEKSGIYPDGSPRSRHTYNSIQYVPALDRFCTFGGAGMYPGGQITTPRTDCFDFAAAKWEAKPDAPTYGIANFSAVDAATGAVWAGKGALTRFDPASGTWGKKTEYDNDIEWTNYLTLEADPARRLLIAVGSGRIYKWDISDPGRPIVPVALATSGDKAIEAIHAPGLAHDPIGGRMVAWAGGSDVYTLDVEAKVWTKLAGGGAKPSQAHQQGTFGRFRHAGGDLFIAVNRTSENVFVYKLAPGGGIGIADGGSALRSRGQKRPAFTDAAGRSGPRIGAGKRFAAPK